jgi:cytochrome c-type biogenesis protein CcmH
MTTEASLAETLIARADGAVLPEARTILRSVLERDPANGMARYYLALAAAQDGDPRGAIAGLMALAADIPTAAPIRAELARQIARVAREAGSMRHRSPARPVTQAAPSGENVRSIGSETAVESATISTANPVGRWTSPRRTGISTRETKAAISGIRRDDDEKSMGR